MLGTTFTNLLWYLYDSAWWYISSSGHCKYAFALSKYLSFRTGKALDETNRYRKSMLFITFVGVFRWLLVGISRTQLFGDYYAFNGTMLAPIVTGMVKFLHESAPEHLKSICPNNFTCTFYDSGQLLALLLVADCWY